MLKTHIQNQMQANICLRQRQHIPKNNYICYIYEWNPISSSIQRDNAVRQKKNRGCNAKKIRWMLKLA